MPYATQEDFLNEVTLRTQGDALNKQLIDQLAAEHQGTEDRLSTEVIQREQGDLNVLSELTALSQAMSEYRIKTDLELSTEQFARQQLGVDLNLRMDNVVASFDHDKYLIYTAIQEVQDDLDGKYASMDNRILRYEDMLQDITTDSIQITTDNGDINMGAWTILSQAREWDLEILSKLSGLKVQNQQQIDQALLELQALIPVEENIITNAIEVFSNLPIMQEMDEALTQHTLDLSLMSDRITDEATARVQGLLDNAATTQAAIDAQTLAFQASINEKSVELLDAVSHESDIRINQIQEIDGNLETYSARVDTIETAVNDPDTGMSALASAVDQVEIKVSEVENGLKTVAQQISGVSTSVGTLEASVQTLMESIDGMEASYTVTVDVNGLITGFRLSNDGETSVFAVNAEYFYIGNAVSGKKPFMVLTNSQTINGVTYPEGTWMDTALIANATIGSAHIASLDAEKITTGTLDAARIAANSITTDKLLIGGGNLVWGGIDDFNQYTTLPTTTAGSSTNSLETSNGLFGNNRFRHDSIVANSYAYICPPEAATNASTGWIRLIPGRRYILSAYVSTNAASDTVLQIAATPREGKTTTFAGGTATGSITMNIADGWQRVSVAFVPTGNDVYLSFYIRNASPNITSYWDGFMVEEVPESVSMPSPYTTGSTTRIDGGNIVTNTVTADHINVTDLSAISANLGSIQVGSGNIANGAITNAKIGTAAITSANIANLTVDTINVKDGAITTSIFGSGVSSLSITSTGGKIRVDIGLVKYSSGNSTTNSSGFRILRNGTVVMSFFLQSSGIIIEDGKTYFMFGMAGSLPSYIDAVAAGTYTYTVQYLPPNGSWTAFKPTSISIFEGKK